MAKPRVRLKAHTPLVVGQECELTFEVATDDAVRVDGIGVILEGLQGWSIGGGKNKVSASATFPELQVDLMGEGVLGADSTTSFDVRFRLKRGTAPTHEQWPAHASFRARLRIAIPWRIDGRYTFELPVRAAVPAEVARTPVIVRSSDAADERRLELSLASSRLVAGEVVVGSVALYQLDDRRHVDVAFVPQLRLFGRGRIRERRGAPIRARIELPADHGGRAVPFQLRLPAEMTPSFETVTHALAWGLEVSTDTLFTRAIAVWHPIEVVDAAARATSARLTEAPRLADQWIGTLFTAVAARTGWRVEPAEPEDGETLAIVGERAHGHARLGHAYRDDGTFLVARLAHPSLGLGLSVVPGSTLRHLFWRDVEIGLDRWDRAHQVAARDAAQAVPFLRAVAPELEAARELGALVRWDDGALVFEQPVATLREEELMPALARLEHLADVIDRARTAIAPPADVAIELDAWRALATWLDGDLATGDLSLTGTLDGVAVHVALERGDGRPAAVRASVGDPAAASEELAQRSLRMAQPLADVLAATVPEAIVECIARWPADLVDLEVERGVASAAFRVAGPAPIAIDAARVRALVLSLRALVTALGTHGGPYR